MNNQTRNHHTYNAIIGTSVSFLGQILLFITYRIIQSTLSKEANGELVLVQTLCTVILLSFAEMGMTSVATHAVINAPERMNTLLSTLLRLRFGLWCVSTAILSVIAGIAGESLLVPLVLCSVQALISSRSVMLRSVVEIPRRARNEQLFVSLLMVLDSVLLAVAVFFDREHITVERVLWWFVLSSVPGFVWLLLSKEQWRVFVLPFNRDIAKELFRSSLPITVSVVLMQSPTLIDTQLLHLVVSKSAVGVYGAASRVTLAALTFLLTFSNALFPGIAALFASDKKQCEHYIRNGLRFIILAATGFAAVVGVLLTWIIFITAGAQYRDNTTEFFLFLWTVAPLVTVAYSLSVCTAVGNNRAAYKLVGTLFVVSLAANIVLTPLFQTTGTIIAKICASALAAFVGLRSIEKHLGAKGRMIPLMVMMLVQMVVLAPIVFFLQQGVDPSAGLLVIIPIFVALSFSTGLLKRSDMLVVTSFASTLKTKILG